MKITSFIVLCGVTINLCSGSIYKNLRYFETLHSDDLTHRIVKRGTEHGSHPFNKVKEVSFRTLGRDFRLMLTPKREVLHSQFKAYELDADGNEKPVVVDHESFYHGRVFGELQSEASVHLEEEGAMTATIHLPDESYHIEPSWRHLPESDPHKMVAYRSSDVKLSWEHDEEGRESSPFHPQHQHQGARTCGYVREGPEGDEEDEEEDEGFEERVRRQADQYEYTPTKTRCPLLLVADYRFYQEMGGSNTKNTINYLISLIDRVHKIYNDTIWHDRAEQDGFKGMGFVIKKIVVHSEATRVRGGEAHYNMVRDKWDVRNLLEVFSREPSGTDVCLRHLFTHQTFRSPHGSTVLGLAYIASSRWHGLGGVCSNEYFKNGYTLYLNSGLSSSRNHYGQRVITREADLVTAHEFGHNWGSEHDPDIPECSPGASQGGSYLMYTYSVSGYDVNNKRFSPCSLRSIRKVLQAKSGRCFSEPEESFCGNLRVEGDEECDAGLLGTEDNDPCCDKNCRLRRAQGASCSDKNSPCCQDCQFMSSGTRCREAQYATCEQESRCTGTSPDCPRSPPMSDGTPCLERGQCRHGKCVPYCETQGLQSCMCDTIGDACKRCCRMNLNDTCFPVDPQDILPDGTPCIQGFCNKGLCEKTIQDVVERFWDIIEDININKVLLFLRDNLVGTVLVVTALLWLPASCLEKEVSLETKLAVEQHWGSCVAASNSYGKDRPKFYVLAMFPYPSGSLHMGHARVYTISDTIARFHRMRGKNVIHPMGWDSFGLPAENAARDRGVDPALWTRDNVAAMRAQLLRLGLCLDWEREIDTSSPQYYAGTQRIFLQLWKAGLVYQDQSLVNWDPVDLTVLADEQVDSQGHSWRSGAKVERRLLTQWFIRTTRFARQLLDGLDSPLLEDWKDIVQLQKHWIGPCDGTLLSFPLSSKAAKTGPALKVWTRSPEERGLFVAISHNHPLNREENVSPHQPTSEGLVLEIQASNPLHGNTLPVIVLDKEENARDDCGYMGLSSCEADLQLAAQLGLTTSPPPSISREEAMQRAREIGIGGYAVSSHLRDWLISRQRRWGTPIPVVKCRDCGSQPVSEDELPLTLPPSGTSLDEWKATKCPKCGGAAERETDTMDTFVDSSWYFLRFLDPHNPRQPFDPAVVAPYMPVDLYVGGKEHAVLHLYYARFMAHFLHSIGWLAEPEPFRRLLVQGMVMGKSYQVKSTGKYLPPDQVDVKGKQCVERETGLAVLETWEKMSKSRFNGTDPNQVLSELGCDATRLLLLADVAPTSHRKWSADTYPGILNWQHRLWLTVGDFLRLRQELSANETSAEAANQKALSEAERIKEEVRLWDSRNFYISGATFNFCVSQQLSVAVTKMQGLTNSLRRTPKSVVASSVQFERALAAQLVMLAPMAPHFACELWTGLTAAKPMLSSDFDWDKPVLQQKWPELDHDYKLDFNIKLNHMDQCVLKVSQMEASTMTLARAEEMAMARPEVLTALGSWNLVRSELEVREGYDLTLNLISVKPEGLEKQAKQPKEKKKKKKKLKVIET